MGIEMRPFNLEEALAGAKVMNGKQEPVTDIAYLPSVNSHYKVYAVINGESSQYTEAGCIFKERTNHLLDLFMSPVKSEGWINIYKGGKLGCCVHKTEEEAQANASPGLIACIRIEWEE
jgi:hypothetical protein